jgi:hypothetical protein
MSEVALPIAFLTLLPPLLESSGLEFLSSPSYLLACSTTVCPVVACWNLMLMTCIHKSQTLTLVFWNVNYNPV